MGILNASVLIQRYRLELKDISIEPLFLAVQMASLPSARQVPSLAGTWNFSSRHTRFGIMAIDADSLGTQESLAGRGFLGATLNDTSLRACCGGKSTQAAKAATRWLTPGALSGCGHKHSKRSDHVRYTALARIQHGQVLLLRCQRQKGTIAQQRMSIPSTDRLPAHLTDHGFTSAYSWPR